MQIILGSASIQRKRILEEAGFVFEVMTANIDEKKIRRDNPKELALAIANAKADFLLQKISTDALLITVDQVVVCNDQIFEKPCNAEEIAYFLRCYSNNVATTITAVTVTNTSNKHRVFAIDIAKVYFNDISEDDIQTLAYNPDFLKCAGGFQVEDKNKKLNPHIKKVVGGVDSVKGLPLKLTKKLLEDAECKKY
ncbi:MAG: Maf family nucleotide pyrophosphatase [Gammaproteobacteria bacterium]|jgi:septum formation protein